MNYLKPASASRQFIAITISLTIIAALTVVALVIFNSQVSRAALPPAFNSHNKAFPIARSNTSGDVANNVSKGNGYETDFFRVGQGGTWNMSGDFGGDSLEVCEDDQVVDLWIYAHNSVATRHNHNAGLNYAVSDLTFTGDGVARNAQVKISSDSLNSDVYTNSHTLTSTLSADNASDAAQSVRIYCDDAEISIESTGLDLPTVKTWAAQNVKIDHNNNPTSTGINQNVKHQKAKEVFGSNYGIVHADQIFNTGALIGYNGNLPSCRYYAAYVKVQVRVTLKEEPQEREAAGSKATSTQEESRSTGQMTEEDNTGSGQPANLNNLGNTSDMNLALVLTVVGLVFVAGTTVRQFAVVRSRRHN